MPDFKISHATLAPLLRVKLSSSEQFNTAMELLRDCDGNTDGCLTRKEFKTLLSALRFCDDPAEIEVTLLKIMTELVPADAMGSDFPFEALRTAALEHGIDADVLEMFLVLLKNSQFKVGPRAAGEDIQALLENMRNKTEEYANQAGVVEDELLRHAETLARSYIQVRDEGSTSAGVSHHLMLQALIGESQRNINLLAEAMLTFDDRGATKYDNHLESGWELASVLRFIKDSVRTEGDASDFIAGINIAFTHLSSNPCTTPQKDCED